MSGSELSKITGTTDVFACIAYPASHVRAPMIFNRIFLEKDLDNVMVALAIPLKGWQRQWKVCAHWVISRGQR